MSFQWDTAGLFVASSTKHFLHTQRGAYLQEIFSKPRRLTISRSKRESLPSLPASTPKTLEGEKV